MDLIAWWREMGGGGMGGGGMGGGGARPRAMEGEPPARLVLKMDVEGSEYELLPALLRSGLGCGLDLLLVEFHAHVRSGVSMIGPLGWSIVGHLTHNAPPSLYPRSMITQRCAARDP